MTATYNTDNTLTELPGMDQPADYPIGYNPMGLLVTRKRKWDEYYEHIESLRTIACSPECRGLWKPGQEVVEGRDYEVRPVAHIDGNLDRSKRWTETAFPLPVKCEDDLWRELLVILDADFKGERYDQNRIAELKKQFIITKR